MRSGLRFGVAVLKASLPAPFWPRVRAVVAAMVGLAAVAVVVWLWRRGPNLTADTRTDLGADGQLQAVDQYRTTLLQVTAALGGVIALAYTARNYQLSRRGQTTDRFTQALEKLGAADMYVRIGGVYALDQVARDSPELQGGIADVLVAFVRIHTVLPEPFHISPDNITTHHGARAVILPAVPEPIDYPAWPRDDIQTALTVLGRLHHHKPLDLSNLHLTHAYLAWADLTRARLPGANLTDAQLPGVNLTGAWLPRANLTGALLPKAKLTDAWLSGADLTDAELRGANLTDASLSGADLTDALLDGVKLTGAGLHGANLTRTRLWRARIAAHQVSSASTSHDAQLPAHLIRDPQLGRVRDATAEETSAAEEPPVKMWKGYRR